MFGLRQPVGCIKEVFIARFMRYMAPTVQPCGLRIVKS